MTSIKQLSIITLLLITSFSFTYAQKNAISEKEKKAMIAKVKSDFWGEKNKEIYKREIPAKWEGESSVILERYIDKEFFRNSKNYLRFINREHEVVKVMNNAALEDYSTLYFPDLEGAFSLYNIHIKVVKADGTEKVVDVEANSLKEEQGGKRYNKIAISDLEVGDIIDYFRVFELRTYFPKTSYDAFPAEYVLFGEEDPIIEYTYNLVMGPSTYMNAKLDNIGEEFEKENFNRDDKKFTKYSLTLKNLDEYNADVRWFYPYAELPNLRYQVFIDNHYGSSDMKTNLSGKTSLNYEPFEYRVEDYLKAAMTSYSQKDFFNGFKDYINEEEKSLKDMSDEEIVHELYYYYRAFYVISDWEYNRNVRSSNNFQFINRMKYVLKELDIPTKVVIAFNKRYTSTEKYILTDELFMFLRAELEEPIYLLNPTAFLSPNEIYSEFQGTKALLYNNHLDNLKEIELPVTSVQDNGNEAEIHLSLDDDMEILHVKRDFIIKGTNKEFYQYRLINLFQYVKESNEKFQIESREENAKKKHREEIGAEIDEYIAEKEKDIEAFKIDDINDDYGVEIEEVEDFKTIHYGNSHTHKNLHYTDEYKLPDLIKKVGPNYLIPIGLFMGSQVAIEEEERERKHNIYMDTPREYLYNITMEIPDGYEITDTDNLKFDIENSSGGFKTNIKIEDNKLKIETAKHYKHYEEPKENWNEMMDFLDAAYKFTQQKILIRKK